jgi:hypothetical protein
VKCITATVARAARYGKLSAAEEGRRSNPYGSLPREICASKWDVWKRSATCTPYSTGAPSPPRERHPSIDPTAPHFRACERLRSAREGAWDGCYYFTAEDDPQVNIEAKLDRMVRLVRLLDFFSTHIENFGEGQIFSASTLAARCNGDTKAERFLQDTTKGSTYPERIENLLQSLVRQGYLSDYDPSRQEYRVLSGINYLFEFADRIEIRDAGTDAGEPDAQT